MSNCQILINIIVPDSLLNEIEIPIDLVTTFLNKKSN
jgi:hypothetical protein